MKAIWSGYIGFGMVNIPIKLYSSTSEERTRLVRLCKDCGSPIGNKYFCKAEEKEKQWNDWDRGYEISDGEYIKITNEQLEAIKLESEVSINIFTFVAKEEIDPLWEKDRYYVGISEKKDKLSKTARKAYALLREVLKKKGIVGIGKLTIRNSENLVTIAAHKNYLLLTRLYYAENIREFNEVIEAEISEQEMALAEKLVESLKKPFDYAEHRDRYEEALQALITGQTVRIAPERKAPATDDLLAQLQASIER